ncbi:hypothetical protein CLK_0163 [Clostridium botulinum A3 str. Loch Maree]|nr:hypothetical protein CLK_0163 [Clostridium botulinum A3 str. Loch Maree]
MLNVSRQNAFFCMENCSKLRKNLNKIEDFNKLCRNIDRL